MVTERTPETDKFIRDKARLYPDWWDETVLGRRLYNMQKAIAQSTFYNKRTTVRSCESSGKTFDAAGIALCFLYNFNPATVITTAPTNRQVEDVLWREIRSAFANAKFPLEGNITRKGLEISEDLFAVGFATDEPERMLGYHNAHILVIADDAAGLDDSIFQAMENPLSTGNAHLLLLSNPTQSTGAFRETFTSDLYTKYHITAFDTPNLTAFGITEEDIASGEWKKKLDGQDLPFPELLGPEKVAERYVNWGPGSYLYTVFTLGDFPDAGINNLFSLRDIEDAMGRDIAKVDYEKNLKVAALDVARYGDDESCFAIRQGNKVLETITWGHQESVYTAGRTARLIRQHKPVRTFVDVVGLGVGVYDILRREIGSEYTIVEFDSGKPALDTERHINRRAEGYWNLRGMMVDGEISMPRNDKAKSQMADIRYTFDNKGRTQIERKEDAKNRGSKSPDVADAIMMAFTITRGSKSGSGRATTF